MKRLSLLKNNKGFTLVEIITVIVILAIIGGISVGGILSYQRYASFKKNEEYAQTIYNAAQSSLTRMKTSGGLSDFAKRVDEAGTSTGNVGPMPSGIATNDKSQLTYLMIQGGDISNNLLFDLIDDYIYDKSIYDGASVCVELDPVDGTVSAALYSDRANSFSYDGLDNSVNITNRDDDYKKENMIGYYGSGVSERAPSISKPQVLELEFDNGNMLTLKWKMNGSPNQYSYYTYVISVFEYSSAEAAMVFWINGSEIKSVSAGVGLLNADLPGGDQDKTDTITIGAFVSADYEITLVFDALDLKAASAEDSVPSSYSETLSAMRFGLDVGKEYYCTVQAAVNSVTSDEEPSNLSYLLSGQPDSETGYIIANARHLFNIRFLEMLNTAEDPENTNGITYTQTKNISWSEFQECNENNLYNIYNGKDNYTAEAVIDATLSTAFPAIPSLSEDSIYSTTTGVDDEVYAISDLIITGSDVSVNLGLFCVNNGKIDGINFESIYVYGNKNVGAAAGENKGTINNVNITGTVYGSTNVGGIVGYASTGSSMTGCVSTLSYGGEVNISDLSTFEKYLTGKHVGGIIGYRESGAVMSACSTGLGSYVFGDEYVGGLIGGFDGATLTDDYKSVNNALVVGNRHVGGIIGQIDTASYGTISNWLNKGLVIARESYAGGLIGYLPSEVEVSNCASQIAADDPTALINSIKHIATGSYVGGLIGYVDGNYTGGSENTESWVIVVGDDYVGGLFGFVSSNTSFSGTAGKHSISSAYVYGDCFVGGLAGANGKSTIFNSLSQISVSAVEGNYFVGGLFGANTADCTNISVSVAPSGDSMGTVTAKMAVAGGLIGYNILLDNLVENSLFEIIISPDEGIEDAVQTIYNAFNGNDSTSDMTISLNSGTSFILNQVKAGVYVGGAVGYNHDGTRLTISEIINAADITATASMSDATMTAYGTGRVYSYAGGIIGRTTKNTTVKKCSNAKDVIIKTGGTFTGSLVEVNDGTVTECKLSAAFDYSKTVYIGGLVGLNGKTGIISSCTLSADVAGNSYVGGIVSVNYGTIKEAELESGKVISENGSAGGVAVINNGTIDKAQVGTSTDSTETFLISALNNVGGVAATNYGKITSASLLKTSVSNNSETASNIGGVAGYNAGEITVSSIATTTTLINISGSASYIGGVAGTNALGAEIKSASGNYADVGAVFSASGAGTCKIGGVSGVNYGTITGMNVSGKVTASSAYSISIGGIAGLNGNGSTAASIKSCTVNGGVEITGGGAANFSNVGGIAGENQKNSSISGVTVSSNDIKSSALANLGGVAGENNGLISGVTFSSSNIAITSTNNSSGNNTGGYVGLNDEYGTIEGDKTPENMTISGSGGTAGGFIGQNKSLSEYKNLTNNAKISSAETAGGIIGDQAAASAAWLISGCVNNASISATNTSGGIVGKVSGALGTIQRSTNETDEEITGNMYAGGIVGQITSTSGTLYVAECKNFGIVRSTLPAGVVGPAMTNANISISDCINVGDVQNISGTAEGGGIHYYSNGTVNILRSRNYGIAKSGVVCNSSEKVTLKDCFGISTCEDPVAPAANDTYSVNSESRYNYYPKDIVGEDIYVKVSDFNESGSTEGATWENIINNGSGNWIATRESNSSGSAMYTWSESNFQLRFNFCDYNGEAVEVNVGNVSVTLYANELWASEYKHHHNQYVSFSVGTIIGGNFVKLGTGVNGSPFTGNYTVETITLSNIYVDNIVICIDNVVTVNGQNNDRILKIGISSVTINNTKYLDASTITSSTETNDENDNTAVISPMPHKSGALNIGKYTVVEGLGTRKVTDQLFTIGGAELYQKVDSKIIDYYNINAKKLTTPTVTAVDSTYGGYKISWTENSSAKSFEIEAYVSDNNSASKDGDYLVFSRTAYDNGPITLNISSEWVGKYLKIRVRSNALSVGNNSEWSEIVVKEIDSSLPEPEFHFELGSKGDEVSYLLVWDNKSKYINGTSLQITGVANYYATEKETTVYSLPTGSNLEFTAQAVLSESDGVKLSEISPFTTSALSTYDLSEGVDAATVTFRAGSSYLFYGITEETLTFSPVINDGSYNTTYRTEVLAYDSDVGVNVVVASFEGTGNSLSIPVGFAGELQEARSYPWISSINSDTGSVWYGKVVKEGLSINEALSNLYNYNEADGYYLERVKYGSYNLMYSPILSDSSGMDGMVQSVDVRNVITVYSAPDVNDIEPKNEYYVFSWDDDISGGTYTYELIGSDTGRIVYESETSKKSFSLIDSEVEKNSNLTLILTRHGSTNAAGYTTAVGSVTEASFNVVKRLIPVQNVICENKGNWNYDITWTWAGDTSDCAGFKVEVTYDGNSESEITVGDKFISLDLSQYGDGSQITISVTVLAPANANYRDSKPTEITFNVTNSTDNL